jgi:hypothetical protein
MEEPYTTQKLLNLRRLTRNTGEIINGYMKEYVATLGPLFRQRTLFGDYIQGSGKEPARNAEQAFKELKSLYEAIATAAPFYLPKELNSPLMQMTPSLELTPWEYGHNAEADGRSKTITVTSPFKFIISYTAYSPLRLKELLARRDRNEGELQQFVLHYLAMHVVIMRQPGLSRLFQTLHFPLGSCQLPVFGALPVTFIMSSISTTLPPDPLILESTELSGKDAFEEIINPGTITALDDPLKKLLISSIDVNPANAGDAATAKQAAVKI